jgi:hypothetical protein
MKHFPDEVGATAPAPHPGSYDTDQSLEGREPKDV